MVGTIFVSKLPADGPPVLSDTKEQIVEHPQPQSLAIDRHRRHAVNAAEQADGELVAAVPRIQIRSEDERPAGQQGLERPQLGVAQPWRPEQPQPWAPAAQRIEMDPSDGYGTGIGQNRHAADKRSPPPVSEPVAISTSRRTAARTARPA